MEKNETINDMFNWFNANIVGLEGLEKTIGKAGAQPQAFSFSSLGMEAQGVVYPPKKSHEKIG